MQRTAVGKALAGENAGELVADPLILAEEVADLPTAHADVAGGNVGICANVLAELGHEGLAETHDFGIGFALGVKVGAALSAAHGRAGEGIFEALLEA